MAAVRRCFCSGDAPEIRWAVSVSTEAWWSLAAVISIAWLGTTRR
jgi:hypothetical protein